MAPKPDYYDQLAMYAKDLAAVFKKVTNGKPKARIGKDGAQQILDVLLKDGAISGAEGAAVRGYEAKVIDQIIYDANFDDAALTPMSDTLVKAIYVDEAHLKAQPAILPNSTMMAPFIEALGHGNVGKISFASPGSKITYSPNQFATIKAMMNEGTIKVYQTELGAFRNNPILAGLEAGSYNSNSNRLVLNSAFDRIEDAVTIVHEATHYAVSRIMPHGRVSQLLCLLSAMQQFGIIRAIRKRRHWVVSCPTASGQRNWESYPLGDRARTSMIRSFASVDQCLRRATLVITSMR